MSRIVDATTLPTFVAELASRDATLAALLARDGVPPLWAREPGFATLLHIILEQQVSLASAKAAFDRLVATIGAPTPACLLDLNDATMLQIGFSRQKRDYARGLAQAVADGTLDLDALAEVDDATVQARLTALRGIGRWTAEIYLLMALGRSDIWPVGDLAIVLAVHDAWHLPARPDAALLTTLAEPWRPYRSVAARMLWHAYLCQAARRKGML